MRVGRLLVVGGGIGGLCAAIALRPFADEVVLAERAPSFAPLGAGLLLAANAVAGLGRLGVDPVPRGRVLSEMAVLRADGRVLSSANPSEICPSLPAIAIHRAALHETLIEGLPEGISVRLGCALRGLQEREGGVDVSFEGGEERFDLVIGADGLHSAVRESLSGPKPVYSGYTCWRAVLPNPGLTREGEMWGPGRRAGYVALPEGVYLFLVSNAPAGSHSTLAELRERFACFADPIPALLDAMGSAEILHHDLSDLPEFCWGRGRIWLLGDAAHAILPNQGQGAAMAIEDAVALGIAMREGSLSAALARYVSLRDERVRVIWRDSRRLGWLGQRENALFIAVRDAILRASPRSLAVRQLQQIVNPGLDLARLS